VFGKVNHHNVHICSKKQHIRDLPEVNMICAISSYKDYGPFFFTEQTVIGINYLDILQLWLVPQLQGGSEDFNIQQDAVPPHFHLDVCAHLSANLPMLIFPDHWIGFASGNDSLLLP
jgi:hypothetical protein